MSILFVKYFLIILAFIPCIAFADKSACHGTTTDGWLEGGVELPSGGNNYTGYSRVARLAGRNFVHSEVREIIVEAYHRLEVDLPTKVFKYAETGYKDGGQFKPHKTHRNGLSVDCITPVKDREGKSVHLPTSALNKFGYSIAGLIKDAPGCDMMSTIT